MSIGSEIYSLADKIFPICRSITGKGVVETLDILNDWLKSNNCPEMKIMNVPTGTPVFDWTVPKEWRITSAYIENEAGEHIIDFKDHPLHVLGYSTPVDEWVDLEELKKHLYVQDDMPDAIPFPRESTTCSLTVNCSKEILLTQIWLFPVRARRKFSFHHMCAILRWPITRHQVLLYYVSSSSMSAQ